LALRAVVFDYGMVLSGPPNAEAHAELIRLTGLAPEQFESCYWTDRLDYDKGVLNGATYWQKFARDAGLSLSNGTLEELERQDVLYWTTYDPQMIAWQAQIKQRGLITGILSNMGESVLANIKREFAWLHGFDVLVWSFELGLVKPEPAIYHHLLDKLGTQPQETLFLDDKAINVEAARELGIHALEFSTIARLRQDLIAAGFDRDLPLPPA